MSIKVEKTDKTNELKLTFTVEAEKFDEGMKTVYKKTAKYFSIPGFRKGKAPMSIIERTYGSSIFYEDTFNEIVPEIYEKELKENNIEAVSRPEIEITQMEKGKDLIFTAVVQTKPEVKLGKYKGVEVEKIDTSVVAADVKKELDRMAEKNARMVSVDNRAVKNKDIAVIDFEGFVNGVPFEGGKAENHELEIGSKTFIPGFEDQVIGMKIDEEKDINVKFPEEYFSKELAGKDATFKVKLHEIKVKELPAIDDEFAKDVSEFDTLKDLKASIKEKLVEDKKNQAKYQLEDAVIKEVAKNTEIDIPSGMIETELDNILKDIDGRLAYQGLNLAQYLKLINKSEDDMRKEYEAQASESVKTRLVLEAIVKAEKIEATDAEIEEKIKEMAKNYGKKEEELLENENLKEYLKNNITTEKAIQFIVDNAKIKATKKAEKTEKTANTEKSE
ncbi:trigger factor [Clostridium sp. CAG:492]|nr:trigger factor [Clostridium sp. CAG:492]